jgi:hypothetical protein
MSRHEHDPKKHGTTRRSANAWATNSARNAGTGTTRLID